MSNATALLTLSKATYVGASGATAAATYSFLTVGYQPPAQERYLDFDIVKNQNGKFKWIYDNGPGFKRWPTFMIRCDDNFQGLTGANAATQYARLLELWTHPGVLGMQAPEGSYSVHWAAEPIEPDFLRYPVEPGAHIEVDVAVQLEEAS